MNSEVMKNICNLDNALYVRKVHKKTVKIEIGFKGRLRAN